MDKAPTMPVFTLDLSPRVTGVECLRLRERLQALFSLPNEVSSRRDRRLRKPRGIAIRFLTQPFRFSE